MIENTSLANEFTTHQKLKEQLMNCGQKPTIANNSFD
jgi:hypothetical protein